MYEIVGRAGIDSTMNWSVGQGYLFGPDQGLVVKFPTSDATNRRAALDIVKRTLTSRGINWIRPLQAVTGDWVIDLDVFRKVVPLLKREEWLAGTIVLTPEFEVQEHEDVSQRFNQESFSVDLVDVIRKESHIRFYITPEEARLSPMTLDFPELAPSLQRFRQDHPDPRKAAFIMMRFEDTRLHMVRCSMRSGIH